MRLIICGDTVSTAASRDGFASGAVDTLFGDVAPILQGADRVLVNLECALTEEGTPIPKFGPNLGAPAQMARTLKAAGVTDCGLANNHMFDFGPEGMMATLEALEAAGLDRTGAGMNEQDSRKPLIMELGGGQTLAILAVSEHEYNYALEDQMGAAPFDPFITLTDIRDLKAQHDRVIVTYHGGKEQCRYPSPRLLRACRAMVDMGADAVLCQHSHIIGCMEQYKGGIILYGQGNFHFRKYLDMPTWEEGLMARFDFTQDGMELTLIPVVGEGAGIRLADGEESARLLGQLQERSRSLADGSWIEGWREFCRSVQQSYEASVFCAGESGEDPRCREHFAHYLDCEAHTDVYRELFMTWHRRGINR